MTQPNNIVVIGAGIVGTSIAVNLLQYGSKITLIDKDTQTNGASRLSFAWINAAGKTPFDYHDLNRRSMEMWPRYGQSLGTNVGLKLGGTVTWETSDDRATALIQKVERAQSYGYPIRLASQSELQIHEPNLVIENVKAASICEIEGQVEPPRVIQAAIDKIIESGGEVSLGESFESFEFDDTNHQIVGLKTNNRTLPCDVVVIAAGIDTTEIGYKANTFLPQSTSPGVVVKTSPMPPLLNGIVYAPSLEEYGREVHMKQLIDGTFVIGEGEQSSKNTDDSIDNARRLVEFATQYLPQLGDAEPRVEPIGYRPMPLDGFPAVGFVKETPNAYMAVTHSGVTLAPLIGELASIEITHGVSTPQLDAFRPNRFNQDGTGGRKDSPSHTDDNDQGIH